MQEEKQGDARIYIISTLFFVCIFAGGVLICLYTLQPEENSTPWYPVVGIVLIAIPWIFWIATYMYRCFVHCFSTSNEGRKISRELSGLTKKQSCSSHAHVGRSLHPVEEEEGSPSGSPDGVHRQVHFGDVVVLGSREYNQEQHGDESPHEYAQHYFEMEHSHDNGIASDEDDHISAASRKGEKPLIVSVSS